MDDMSGLLAQNFGIRGQGKSAPMAASKTASTHRSVPSSSYDDIFNSTSSSVNNNSNRGSSTVNQTAHDPMLDTFNKGPVFDTPAYDDDDIFNGVPGIRSSSTSSFKYDDVFASDRSPPPYDDLLGSIGKGRQSPPAYDDLLGGLGMGKRMDHGSAEIKGQGFTTGFEDLLPGFGSSTPMSQPEREAPHETAKTAATPSTENDPFFVVETGTSTGGSFSDPLDNLTKPSEAVKVDASSPTHSFFSENPPNSSDSMPSFSAATGGDFTQSERSVETEGGSDPFGGTTKYEQSPESSEHSESGDDIWLTVSEIPLFTKPTSAPPPSRPAPPLSSSSSSPEQDEYGGEMERSSAAMKDAMNKAELKFKHAKEVREKMAANERDNKAELEMQERLRREEEQKRLERERGRARQAVERATREARERAANEAMLRAQRGAVQRAQQEARERAAQEAKDKAAAAEVAREREREKAAAAAERAAAAAAAERAAKEREAKERERRMQRAAVEKAAAEARERLAQAAKEKHQQQQTQQRPPAAVATSAHQQQTQQRPPAAAAQQNDDFDSIFGMGGSGGSRSSSVPKKNPQESQAQTRTPSASAATVRKTAVSPNMMDDLSAIFGGGGGPSSSGEFQEIQGETEDRRKARFEREMRTRDRAAKALAEKNARDMQVQQEQAERHRIGETLDFEIKRWAAGKEGNLRSLLSSLHYILWAECGWQPVSMADLITGASVKKVYRKATLCIHPDKVQQKGATLQQKYIAEKVFDILKEAWNKFNSEELF